VAGRLTAAAVMIAVEHRMGGRFGWGGADCTLCAGAVFADLHGIDPTAGLAGRYDDARSAARMIRAAGGMLTLGHDLAAQHGLRPVAAETGAIGIVAQGRRQAAAICVLPGMWAAKAELGFVILREAVAAWSI
jgi:hypothetical protein